MEGTVVDLTAGDVAKIWHGRGSAELEPFLRFGSAVEQSPIPFRCSQVSEILEEDGLTVTIEQKVSGEPLRLDAVPNAPLVTDGESRFMGDALAGLSQARSGELNALPALPGEMPFSRSPSFGKSLADLVQRRFTARPELLRREISDIDQLIVKVLRRLRELPVSPTTGLIHGDLIPANVLIEDGEVAGVVDFGFLTTVGDPQFDAAITASIFDMYGPNARETENTLTDEFCARFDHDLAAYGLYRAAYAVITNSYFAVDGDDGHFQWCAEMLERDDVRSAIG